MGFKNSIHVIKNQNILNLKFSMEEKPNIQFSFSDASVIVYICKIQLHEKIC